MIGLPDLRLFSERSESLQGEGRPTDRLPFRSSDVVHSSLCPFRESSWIAPERAWALARRWSNVSKTADAVASFQSLSSPRESLVRDHLFPAQPCFFTPSTTTPIVQPVVDRNESTPSNIARAEASCPERSVPSIDNPPPGTARQSSLISSSRQDSTRQSSNLRLGK